MLFDMENESRKITRFPETEQALNGEQKTLCCFVLDVSSSMGNSFKGEVPINNLNKSFQEFQLDTKLQS